MWIIPLVVIGLCVLAAANRGEAAFAPARYAPPPPPPGPIAVLGELVRVGMRPPPQVILCAIAEAEAIGRNDLASDIVRVFVAPVVYEHELARAHAAAPQAQARAPRQPESPASAPRPITYTDDQLRAMLNADPERFVEMVTRGGPAPVIDVPEAPPPALEDLPPVFTPAYAPEDPGLHHRAVPAAPSASPIVGIDPAAWDQFCGVLERETPLYQSARHVGQYRQRKDRLAELGINPVSVLGSTTAQRAALDADLADAHRHATAAGFADDHVGRLVALPGDLEPHVVSLSGVLGVVQAAGFEGAVGWFENRGDRKRFPHTTQAFLRTNGVF